MYAACVCAGNGTVSRQHASCALTGTVRSQPWRAMPRPTPAWRHQQPCDVIRHTCVSRWRHRHLCDVTGYTCINRLRHQNQFDVIVYTCVSRRRYQHPPAWRHQVHAYECVTSPSPAWRHQVHLCASANTLRASVFLTDSPTLTRFTASRPTRRHVYRPPVSFVTHRIISQVKIQFNPQKIATKNFSTNSGRF